MKKTEAELRRDRDEYQRRIAEDSGIPDLADREALWRRYLAQTEDELRWFGSIFQLGRRRP